MKRILIVISSLSGGGAERVATIWANELFRLGYEVVIMVAYRQSNEYYLNKGISVISIANKRDEYSKYGLIKKTNIYRKTIKGIDPDVIISFLQHIQVLTMLSTIGMKMKRVETVRVSPWIAEPKNLLFRFLWKTCFKKSDCIIVQTKSQMDYFGDKEKIKCVVIPNPLSQEIEKHYRVSAPKSVQKFIAVGRVTEQKNYISMIKAFNKAREMNKMISLDIYGDSENGYDNLLLEEIKKLQADNYIKLCGRNPRVIELYKQYDAFIMTSDYEGMPNALAEAMAAGLVCISTDCRTGPRDMIDDTVNGYLVPVGDVEKIEQAIETVCKLDEITYETISKNARNKIKSMCDRDKVIEKLTKVVE